MTATTTRKHSSRNTRNLTVADDDGDDEAPMAATTAVDPLAAEPLTADEIRNFEPHDPPLEEEVERTYRAIQINSEVDMPVDVDSGDLLEEPTDSLLDVRLRPKARR